MVDRRAGLAKWFSFSDAHNKPWDVYLTSRKLKVGRYNVVGATCFTTRTVYVDANQTTEDNINETTLHELLHVSHQCAEEGRIGFLDEEKQVKRISEPLYCALMNAKLIMFPAKPAVPKAATKKPLLIGEEISK